MCSFCSISLEQTWLPLSQRVRPCMPGISPHIVFPLPCRKTDYLFFTVFLRGLLHFPMVPALQLWSKCSLLPLSLICSILPPTGVFDPPASSSNHKWWGCGPGQILRSWTCQGGIPVLTLPSSSGAFVRGHRKL